MRANAEKNAESPFTSPKVLVFPRHMAKAARSSSQPDLPSGTAGGYNPQKHGTWAQWASPVVAVFAFIIATCSLLYGIWSHNEANQAKASDDHVNQLIEGKLDPRLDKINDRLDQLIQQLGEVQGEVHRNAEAQDVLRSRVDQQIALANMTDPERVDRALAVIRTEIVKAESSNQPVAVAEYRAAVRDLPDTAVGYWKTVAAIINYQSLLDQKAGLAPNPKSVAHTCFGLTAGTGGENRYENMPISNCILDLDTTHNQLDNVTIKDSVIRYHGGPIAVHNVVLMNCYFDLDLTHPPNPSAIQLLRAVLDSPEQKTVTISHVGPTPE